MCPSHTLLTASPDLRAGLAHRQGALIQQLSKWILLSTVRKRSFRKPLAACPRAGRMTRESKAASQGCLLLTMSLSSLHLSTLFFPINLHVTAPYCIKTKSCWARIPARQGAQMTRQHNTLNSLQAFHHPHVTVTLRGGTGFWAAK